MNVFLIGELNDSNRILKDACAEIDIVFESSGSISSDSLYLKTMETAALYDNIILDLPYLRTAVSGFSEGLTILRKSYKGTVIIYAPNTDYTDEMLKLCYANGFTKVIRDYLSAGVKRRLIEYLSKQEPPKPEQPIVEQNREDTIGVSKKIGVIGIMPRIGTTTQAVQLVKTLVSLEKSVCYVQENDSTFLDSLELFFSEVQKDSANGRLVYHDLLFYKDRNYAYSKDYDYMVTDYGFASSEQLPTDFYSNDIRIVVCGGNAEEVATLTTLSHQLYRDESIIYIFSFIDPDDRPEVLDLMGDRREMVHFAPYTPDCFRSYEESGTLYRELLGFREEQTVKPKRGFGRKRRR